VPENLLPLIERHRITSFFAPPTVWIALLRSPLFDRTDLSSLKKGYYGASIMPVEVLRELAERLPAVRLWNLYGQTEIAPLATMLGPDDQLTRPARAAAPSSTSRRASSTTRCATSRPARSARSSTARRT
jgi:fatty-acyl-CoA synthase